MKHFKVEWGPALPTARNVSGVRCLLYQGFTVACAAGGRSRNLDRQI